MAAPKKEAGEELIRTFVCIEVPRNIQKEIEALQQRLSEIKVEVSWVKPSNIHLTLKFLGRLSQRRLQAVRGAAERASRSTCVFPIELGQTGCFPTPSNPRVLWVGLKAIPDGLKTLYEALEQELATEGFPRESRKFAPHLTVGRLRSALNARQLAGALISAGFPQLSFQAAELCVMRSTLKPTGSIYTPQATYRLSDS